VWRRDDIPVGLAPATGVVGVDVDDIWWLGHLLQLRLWSRSWIVASNKSPGAYRHRGFPKP
jgi:hypothetical protein